MQFFVVNNLPLFEQQGVLYPKLTLWDKGLSYCHDALLRVDTAALNNTLEDIKQSLEGLSFPAHTLLLSVDHALYLPEKLSKLVERVRTIFPEASIHCITDFAPQHDELYSIFCAVNLFLPDTITTSQQLLDRYAPALLYDQSIATLEQIFGVDNLSIAKAANTQEQALQNVLNSLLSALMPDSAPDFLSTLDHARCSIDFMVPLPLIHLHLQAPQLYLRGLWFSQHQKFCALGQKHPEFYGLFTQQERENISAYYQKSNARTAALCGVSHMFPVTYEGLNIPPYQGLTIEHTDMVLDCVHEDLKGALLLWSNPLFAEQLNPSLSSHIHKRCNAHFLPIKSQRQSKAKLAVLTLSYNQADYIAQTIESVLAQETDFPIEHLISDDGSTDGTQDIIMDYARKYPHIVPLMKSHRGAPNTYNIFKNTCTPYVSLCDGDDYFIDPHKLQIQVDFLEKNRDCALCFHPVEVRYENNIAPPRLFPTPAILPRGVRERYYVSDLIKGNFIQTNSVVYRWRFQEGLPEWFDPTLAMGDWYWHLLHAELGPIGYINRVMAVYRRHDKSLYYTSEVSMREHMLKHGMEELRTYETVNRHFNNKYEKYIFGLANAVFIQFVHYALDTGDNGPLDEATKRYPHFATVFKLSLKHAK